MSTVSTHHASSTLLDPPKPTSLTTLVGVELRKLLDTRAVLATVVVAALLAGATGGGQTLRGDSTTFGDITQMALLFAPYFLVALGATLVAGEYNHRTALTTFALVPRRGRILAAKAGAIVTLSLVVAVLGLVAGVLISAVAGWAGLTSVSWSIDVPRFVVLVAGIVIAALIGWAIGMATGSTVIALAAYLVWPMVSTMIGSFSDEAARVLAWLRPDAVFSLAEGITATTAGQTATSLALWILLPAALGWARLTKGEVR